MKLYTLSDKPHDPKMEDASWLRLRQNKAAHKQTKKLVGKGNVINKIVSIQIIGIQPSKYMNIATSSFNL